MRLTPHAKERGRFSVEEARTQRDKWNRFYRDNNQYAIIHVNEPGSHSVYIVNQYGVLRGWLR